ncbi:unnamed protein product [Chondrus crispus]|uniref:TIGR01777 family protein n=1 Tax=Chondrus crispus TaxID=2769 RepID=R7QUG9_CHOCR|nr:unnamed protein product [Chondrus crispus]CDF41126.1 unnamed protein product [Chondrus crispus]|eukprot:XP_005711420.1 unnamed protein product [Chondrus crispus]
MALQHVVVAGGTGFVGSRLVRHLQGTGAQVTVLTRSRGSASALPAATRVVVWAPDKLAAVGDDWVGWQDSLRGADLVVNLCGEPVVSRWDARGRQAIVESRVKATTALAEAVRDMPTESRPKCVVSASAVGYYGTSAATVFDEGAAPARDDFLADVCVRWEEAAKGVLEGVEGTRLVVVRIGVVLGVGGGALARMLPAFKMFVGGKVGSGEQWVSWVHVDDLVRIFVEAGENEDMRGVYNATAPRPVTMGELAQALADALKRPNLFPVPGVVLKLALGGAAQVVLEGQKVLPKRLLERGFKFQHETVESAMKAVAEEA